MYAYPFAFANIFLIIYGNYFYNPLKNSGIFAQKNQWRSKNAHKTDSFYLFLQYNRESSLAWLMPRE